MQCKTPEDAVPIIDDHILARLTSLAEMICSDDASFSTEQCEDFLDRILRQSTIVRPLPQKSQQRLQSYHLRPLSLAQLRHFCSSMPSDLNEFLAFLKQRTLPNDDALLDYLTETIVKILNDRSKLTDEQRQNFFSFVDKQAFGKKRYQPIYEAYQKSRINAEKLQPTAPAIDRSYLSQLLNSISRQEYQVRTRLPMNTLTLTLTFARPIWTSSPFWSKVFQPLIWNKHRSTSKSPVATCRRSFFSSPTLIFPMPRTRTFFVNA